MRLQRSRNKIFIYFGKEDWQNGLAKAANASIKQMVGRRWYPDEKKWSVPDTPANNQEFERLNRDYGVGDRVDPGLFDVEEWANTVFGEPPICNSIKEEGEWF